MPRFASKYATAIAELSWRAGTQMATRRAAEVSRSSTRSRTDGVSDATGAERVSGRSYTRHHRLHDNSQAGKTHSGPGTRADVRYLKRIFRTSLSNCCASSRVSGLSQSVASFAARSIAWRSVRTPRARGLAELVKFGGEVGRTHGVDRLATSGPMPSSVNLEVIDICSIECRRRWIADGTPGIR